MFMGINLSGTNIKTKFQIYNPGKDVIIRLYLSFCNCLFDVTSYLEKGLYNSALGIAVVGGIIKVVLSIIFYYQLIY